MPGMGAKLVLMALLAIALFAGCTTPSPYANVTANATPPVQANVTPAMQTVQVYGNPVYGNMLTDANGMTLYVFTADKKGVSNCNSATCLSLWSPVIADKIPAISGASGTFSLITRNDSRIQLAYNGMPLYTFFNDTAPGDAKGQGFGGKWFVAQTKLTDFPATVTQGQAQNATHNVTGNVTPTAQNASKNTTGNSAQQQAPNIVKISYSPTYGVMMTDAKGMTLYVSNKDSFNLSACDSYCAQTWPPLISDTVPVVPGAPGAFGLILRPGTGGKKQVTYNGMPLYTYSYDQSPGDATGNRAFNQWYIATPSLTDFPRPMSAYSSGSGY